MKCAKSRKAKNSRSASGSLGTAPGWRSASSETIRGDAEPTGGTGSSALGNRATEAGQPEDDPGGRGADVVHVQLGLGQPGDEAGQAGSGIWSWHSPRVRHGGPAW